MEQRKRATGDTQSSSRHSVIATDRNIWKRGKGSRCPSGWAGVPDGRYVECMLGDRDTRHHTNSSKSRKKDEVKRKGALDRT